jgi:hypothetical protein
MRSSSPNSAVTEPLRLPGQPAQPAHKRSLRHWRLRFALAGVLLACLALPHAPAQEPDAELPSLDDVLEKFVASLGGREAYEKLTSREVRSSATPPRSSRVQLSYVTYSRRPNLLLQEARTSGGNIIRQGYDGEVGWEEEDGKLRSLHGVELAELRRTAVFDWELRLRELFPEMRVTGATTVGRRKVWRVHAVPELGRPEAFYFDAENGRMLRRDTEHVSGPGVMLINFYYENHRTFDGIELPRRIRVQHASFELVMVVNRVRHNLDVPDEKFAPPQP